MVLLLKTNIGKLILDILFPNTIYFVTSKRPYVPFFHSYGQQAAQSAYGGGYGGAYAGGGGYQNTGGYTGYNSGAYGGVSILYTKYSHLCLKSLY